MPIPWDCGPTRHGPHRRCPRSPRPASVWPCATASHRKGTGLISDWLPTAVTQIVTTYTQPRDHVLLLIPLGHLDAVAERPAPGSNGLRGNGAFAGLAEAAWAVARLGRIIHPESNTRTDTAAPERYHLVITTVDPRARRLAPTLGWADLLHPDGVLAVITHSDSSAGRLIDPTDMVVRAARHAGLTYLDHIALLEIPLHHGPAASTTPLPSRRNRRTTRAIRAHSDLLIFSRTPGAAIRADHKETPNA
ncbi:MAG: hypothetical protein JO281_20110 [Pseudonocardiales bacterium]|nr:hypothetical protein [Pseudonocardiales bacterium]